MPHQRTHSLSPKRQRHHYARTLVDEYLRKMYPGSSYQLQVRVGPINPLTPIESEAELRLVGHRRPVAAAVVVLPKKLIVIHAALNPTLDDVTRTDYLRGMAKQTPELEPWLDRPVKARLLYVYPRLGLQEHASALNVNLTRFVPSFLRSKTSRRYGRKTRAPEKGKRSPSTSEPTPQKR